MTNIITPAQLADFFDSTNLCPTANEKQISLLCKEAVENDFHSVCVNPRWVALCSSILYGTGVKVCTVISFPLGADTLAAKIFQAQNAINAGADEIDMVADLSAIIESDEKYCRDEMGKVLNICRSADKEITLKVIIEAAALTNHQKISICKHASEVGVDFVKTSTGLHPSGGATLDDVKLMVKNAPNCKVKAAGGIRTLKDTFELIGAGAKRIGTSSAKSILDEFISSLEQI